MLYCFLAIVAVLLLCYGIDVFCNRHPLSPDELRHLAHKRQRNRALFEYRFGINQRPAEPTEKKAMNSAGEFLACDLDYNQAPSRIAGLLKYKKHEWIVFAFIVSKRVTRLWWNKGPDGTRVWPFLHDHAFETTIRSLNPNAIAILHNHPNPDPSRYRMNMPSNADLTSAEYLHHRLTPKGVSVLEFICERGVPHLYYAAFADNTIPVEPILTEIHSVNGTGIFKNYSLRKELRNRTPAEQIYGNSQSTTMRKVA
jgi:hypothetical protein